MEIHINAPFNIGDKVYIFDEFISYRKDVSKIARTIILGFAFYKDYEDDKPKPKYIIRDLTEEYSESYKNIELVFGSPDEVISAFERSPALFGITNKDEAKEIAQTCKNSKVNDWA